MQAYVGDNQQNGHDVIVLNLAKGADPKKPETWGEKAVYVDPQNNVVLHNNIPAEREKIQKTFLTGDGGVARDKVLVHRSALPPEN